MAKYAQGIFIPKNPVKYIGKGNPVYRSSWELAMMNMFDQHPNVAQWASESIQIPYRNPLTQKNTIYVPDFFVYYIDKNGRKVGELIEIKPRRETTMEAAKSKQDKLRVIINQAKWAAATAWCRNNGLTFRIMSEDSLFRNSGVKK